jgi:hypothetical protein
MGRDYAYSYEIYGPEDADGGSSRIDYEDHFTTRKHAVAAMKEVMAKDDIPIGSTSFVCRRYDCGEMTDSVDYVKRVIITKEEGR